MKASESLRRILATIFVLVYCCAVAIIPFAPIYLFGRIFLEVLFIDNAVKATLLLYALSYSIVLMYYENIIHEIWKKKAH